MTTAIWFFSSLPVKNRSDGRCTTRHGEIRFCLFKYAKIFPNTTQIIFAYSRTLACFQRQPGIETRNFSKVKEQVYRTNDLCNNNNDDSFLRKRIVRNRNTEMNLFTVTILVFVFFFFFCYCTPLNSQ